MAYGDGYSGGYGVAVVDAHPTVTVEIAFATAPFAASHTWTDVTAKVAGGSVNRGRSSELDKMRAGQATVVLANEDRRFDPTHAGGPHYPNVLPMRRLRIRAVYNSVTYNVFTGYIDRWEQTYDNSVAHAVVTATDAFKVFAAKTLPGSVYAQEVTVDGPVAWWRLGEPSGAAGVTDVVAGRFLTRVGAPESAASLVTRESDGAAKFPASTDGFQGWHDVLTAAPMTVEVVYMKAEPTGFTGFGQRNSRGEGWAIQIFDGVPNFAVAYTVGGTPASTVVDASVNVNDGSPHHLAGVWEAGGNLRIYVDGVDRTIAVLTTAPYLSQTQTGGNKMFLNAGDLPSAGALIGTISTWDEAAVYNKALTAARVAAHADARATPWDGELSGTRVSRVLDSVGWPAADRLIDAGVSTLQAATFSGTALSYLQKVEESEVGLLFVTGAGQVRFRSRHGGFNLTSQATFGDGGGAELDYADIAFDWSESLIYNEIRVSRADGVVQVAEDTTSQASYGERTYTSDGLFHTSDAESYDRAQFILGRYKDPVFRTTRMVVQPSGDNAAVLYPQVLGRELGDKMTVRRKPQNVGATIDQTVLVEGVRHEFADRWWRTEYFLSPSSATSTPGSGDADYLQLDDTDGPGLGFVRLAY